MTASQWLDSWELSSIFHFPRHVSKWNVTPKKTGKIFSLSHLQRSQHSDKNPLFSRFEKASSPSATWLLEPGNKTLASIKFILFNECHAMFGWGVGVCVSSQKHSFWSTAEEKQPGILLKSKAFTTKGMHPSKSTFPIRSVLVLWEFAFNFGYTSQNLTYC